MDFTYAEIQAEAKRLGYAYPNADDFTEEEITEAVAGLSDYYLTNDVASLTLPKPDAAVVKAFATLASLIKGGELTIVNSSMTVKLATTTEQRRQSALYNLQSARWQLFQDAAKDSLKNSRATQPDGWSQADADAMKG